MKLVFSILCASMIAASADDQPIDDRGASRASERRSVRSDALTLSTNRHGSAATKRRQELRKLPPQERQAKMKELRDQVIERRKVMTREEVIAKRQEIKLRFERQLAALRQKKTDGTLTPQESKRLQRLETIAQRFKQARAEVESRPPPAP